MKRRTFIRFLGGAAAGLAPSVAFGQQAGQTRRIGHRQRSK
jgi:hypothetical protein